jgi:ubiquinone/menaquinone biosynthesis C-methylase UbiE
MSDKLPEVFWEIHSNLPREGPGDNKSTKKAYMKLKNLPKNPYILDIGCGPGMQTIELAKLSGGNIVALDFHQPFLEQLEKSAKEANVQDRIEPVLGSMFDIKYDDGSFDLIWCEGAIFVIGFEKGLHEWRRLLTKGGYLALSEMVWLQPDPPKEVVEFMETGYPEIKTAEENLEIVKSCGYRVVDSFVLPSRSWWDNYYNHIQAKLPALKEKYKDDKEAMEFMVFEDMEIDMFRKYSDYYGYIFYILQVNKQ